MVTGLFACLAIAALVTFPSGAQGAMGRHHQVAGCCQFFVSIALAILVIFVTGWISEEMRFTIAWWIGLGLPLAFFVPDALRRLG